MSVPEGKEQVFLESDDEIRGQKYVCLSFLTPNRGLLRRKDLFFFSEFLKFYALDYKIKSTESFVLAQLRDLQNAVSDAVLAVANADLTDASGAAVAQRDTVAKLEKLRGEISAKTSGDLEAHVKANLSDFRESTINEEYEKWMVVNKQKLEDQFHKDQNFQTTVHGLKVRGVYSTHDQAVARAKALNKKDPYFNVYVADVGEWLPWDPEPDEVPSSEYQNEELNKLMQSYKENAAKREAFFEEEKRQKVAAAAAAAQAAKEAQAATKKAKEQPTFGEQAQEQSSTEAAKTLFDDSGDLALARRREQAAAATEEVEAPPPLPTPATADTIQLA
jgi:hypothetical protein